MKIRLRDSILWYPITSYSILWIIPKITEFKKPKV